MKKALTLFGLNLQDALDSRARSFVWFLLSVINPLSLLIFWQGNLANQSAQISGWNASSITSYYLLLIFTGTLLHVHIEEEVAEYDIKEGRLSTYLLRPYSYLRFKLFAELPYRLLQSGYAIIILLVISILYSGALGINSNFTNLLAVVPIFVFAYFISFFFKMIVGTLTFWMTDYSGLQELVFVALLVLAGFVMPLEFYPKILADLARLTPFPYMIYYPVVVLQGNLIFTEIIKLLVKQIFWIAALYLVYTVLWKKGIKKFTAIGI